MCFFRKALFLKQPMLLFQLKQFYITMTFSINDVNEAVPVSVTNFTLCSGDSIVDFEQVNAN